MKNLFLFIKRLFKPNSKDEKQENLSEINQSDFKEAEAETRDKAQNALNLANDLISRGNVNEALEHYNESISLNPDCAASYFYRGNALAVKGNMTGAIANYEKAVDLGLKWADNYANLGNALEQIGERQEAIKMYIQALALNPEQEQWYTALYVNLQTEREKPKSLHETTLSLYAEY